MRWSKLLRQFHFYGSLVVAIPVVIIITTGVVTQIKKDSDWVQPPTQKTSKEPPTISPQAILEAAKQVPEAEIEGWEDVQQLDVRPSKGVTKVRANNAWEVQVDHQTGEVVQVAYRRSDLIQNLHDGSYFSDEVKIWIFFPSGVVLLILWISGVYLMVYPYWAKGRRAKKRPIPQH